MTALRPKHIKALRRAVREAAAWRGSMTGNPDPAPLRDFDKFIADAKEALAIINAEQPKKASKENNQ